MQRRLPQVPQVNVIDDFFAYSTGVQALAATVGATITTNILIQADSDFVAEKFVYFADTGAALTNSTQIVPLVQIMLTDTGSGRQLFNTPLNLDTIAGNGALPYILSRPKLFDANSVIQVTMVNRLAQAYNIEFVMTGRKRFTLGN